MLLIISSVIQKVKQDIKDEGKSQRYNQVIKCAEEIDAKIADGSYTETCYTQLFEYLKTYVNYINDNYDISKLPNDERDIIELVIEATLKGLDSDIEKLNYEYSLITNVCKNSYRYFRIIDKVFSKIQAVYDESLERGSIDIEDYINFYKEIYDTKIKTLVNDVHRSIKTEDEYLEYSRQLHEDEGLMEFMLNQALLTTESEAVKEQITEEFEKYVKEEPEEVEQENTQTETDAEQTESVTEDAQEGVEIVEEHFELDGGTELNEVVELKSEVEAV